MSPVGNESTTTFNSTYLAIRGNLLLHLVQRDLQWERLVIDQ